MARASKEICDRDAFGEQRPATATRRFSVDDEHYILRLCDQHAAMFDREMMGWIRLAHDDESRVGLRMQRSSSFVSAELKERDRRAAELRAAQQKIDAETEARVHQLEEHRRSQAEKLASAPRLNPRTPGEGWVITPHAKERAEQRGYSTEDILAAAEHPEVARANKNIEHLIRYGEGSAIHARGECVVVVNPARKVIITVLHRNQRRHLEESGTPQSNTTEKRIAR